MRIVLIHAPADDIEVIKEASIYAPKGYCYFLPEKLSSEDFVEFARDRYQLEKERNEWIRKYDNVINGLVYWRNRCLESECDE